MSDRRYSAFAMINNSKTGASVCDSLAHGASGPDGVGESAVRSTLPRTDADDERVCVHEGSHALAGRVVGSQIGGVTVEPSIDGGYAGLCWGPDFDRRRAKFADERSASSALCEQIAGVMPKLGESRADAAPIFSHVHDRLVEVVAGTEGERLLLPGEPWFAADDERQAFAYASLITSSPQSAEALIAFARIEAAALLREHEHVVHALAEALRTRRTLDGDEVDAIIARAVAAKALADEHARRAAWRRIEQSAARFLAHQER